MEKVKVQVTDNPQGHRHIDHEVEPGEILEVWPHQAAFLHERGIAVAYSEKKARRSRKSETEDEVEAPSEESVTDHPSEGADETPDQ